MQEKSSANNNIPGAVVDSFKEIEKIAGQQLLLLQSADTIEEAAEPLQQFSDRRQSCMDLIDEWKKETGIKDSAGEWSQIEDIIKRTLDCDKKSQEMLKKIIVQTSTKLVNVQGMKKANRAYNEPTSTNNPWFIDRKR